MGGDDTQPVLVNPPGAARTDQILPLTGLRFFAALAVYASHVGPPPHAGSHLKALFASGYFGVTLFFVLSGFVLAINYFGSMVPSRISGRVVWNFAVSRFARVYPLYLLILMLVVTSHMQAGQSTPGLLRNVLALQTWSGSDRVAYGYVAPAWSIGVEFFLYACFPLLVLALAPAVTSLRRCAALTGAVVVAMIALAVVFVITGHASVTDLTGANSAHRWLYRTPVTRLGDFLLGILAARMYLHARDHRRARTAGTAATTVGALVILVLMAWPDHVNSAPSWDVSYAVPSTALILGLALSGRSLIARVLSLKPMVLLGEASYAMYLIHFPMVAGSWRNHGTNVGDWVSSAITTLTVVILISIYLHVWFERPARRAIRRALTRRPKPA